HGALFGHGAFQPADGKITFVTGSSVMATIAEFIEPPGGVTTTIAWSLEGTPTYAFEGNILVSASILPWTADLLGLSGVDALLELAQSVESSLGVQLVPAHVGLGSPHWNSAARGLISGLSFGSGPAHVARAATESIALQVRDVFEILEPNFDNGIGRLHVDGGPSGNSFLMSMVADYLDHPIITEEATEASALGAAYLAGLTVGFWPNLEALFALKGKSVSIEPSMEHETRNSRLLAWKEALNRSTLGT
ncbi:MAG: FGGY-family carbohydrate kinase, partial [Stappiaceae bacterium]